MIAPTNECQHETTHKHGRTAANLQRFKCADCGKTFTEYRPKPIGNMRIDLDRACMALNLLVEGTSVRTAERIVGLHRDTICALIISVGPNLDRFHQRAVVNVPVQDVQIDEIWDFVGKKSRQVQEGEVGVGDAWTYTAIERETKILLSYHFGKRNAVDTDRFLTKLRHAVDDTQRYQITSDGFQAYRYGVPLALGSIVDFGQLIKRYSASQTETRYSPAAIVSCERVSRFGSPAEDRICTSHVERMNLTIRMSLRRFTRLTNAFSKSLDHHTAMQSIFFSWYNWCRKHSTIGCTPAMASGLIEKPLTIRQLLEAAV